MRVKILALACVAALATVMPARADIVLGYAISSFMPATQGDTFPPGSPIPNTNGSAVGALGAVIVGNSPANRLNFLPGETKFLQIFLTGNAAAPYNATQMAWDAASLNSLITTGLIFNYPVSLVAQPFTQPTAAMPNINRSNASTSLPFANGHPNTFPGYNMGQTAITGADTGAGLDANMGIVGPHVLFTLKLRAGMNPGTGTISVEDLNPPPTAAIFGLGGGENLDPIVFSAAHAGFPLFIAVVAIPEPSSMALAGLAIAGFGWRKLRRKTPVVA